eukprot:gnl/TRDRNA2_/TRDRNA2_175371_c0_seq1.p1 gnl/TRDRNA2_/TRDRNA2_175371_c0~~gnl/TRDRNA2_/TRDRNA2_175371_c0_seq1.p1  ORF type:complete len:400 (-),score=100.01 gnl/TRDRNA2_/TRDRNA2_175371_c0_seq1:221-1420(-)
MAGTPPEAALSAAKMSHVHSQFVAKEVVPMAASASTKMAAAEFTKAAAAAAEATAAAVSATVSRCERCMPPTVGAPLGNVQEAENEDDDDVDSDRDSLPFGQENGVDAAEGFILSRPWEDAEADAQMLPPIDAATELLLGRLPAPLAERYASILQVAMAQQQDAEHRLAAFEECAVSLRPCQSFVSKFPRAFGLLLFFFLSLLLKSVPTGLHRQDESNGANATVVCTSAMLSAPLPLWLALPAVAQIAPEPPAAGQAHWCFQEFERQEAEALALEELLLRDVQGYQRMLSSMHDFAALMLQERICARRAFASDVPLLNRTVAELADCVNATQTMQWARLEHLNLGIQPEHSRLVDLRKRLGEARRESLWLADGLQEHDPSLQQVHTNWAQRSSRTSDWL